MPFLRTLLGPIWFWAAWTVIGIVALAVGLLAAALIALATWLTIGHLNAEVTFAVGALATIGVCATLDRLNLLPRREEHPVTLSLTDHTTAKDADTERSRH